MGDDKLSELANELTEATVELIDAEKIESQARSVTCSAKNRVNKAQKVFDEFVDGMRKSAPRNTDWKRPYEARRAVKIT
jgi:hypothetical protein